MPSSVLHGNERSTPFQIDVGQGGRWLQKVISTNVVLMHEVQIKRIYAVADRSDGYRVLVDRLWPRGIKKETAGLDIWFRDIAPSTELRKNFDHQYRRFDDFRTAYRNELDCNQAALEFVGSCEIELRSRNVTLLYAAKDEICNNAIVLREWIEQHLNR